MRTIQLTVSNKDVRLPDYSVQAQHNDSAKQRQAVLQVVGDVVLPMEEFFEAALEWRIGLKVQKAIKKAEASWGGLGGLLRLLMLIQR